MGGYRYTCCVGPSSVAAGGAGSSGAVRVVWCIGGARGAPSFPSTNVGP
jgi:hypothetical protein